MFKRILILVAGSPGDRFAVDYGVGFARSSNAEAHVVGVVQLPTAAASIDEVKDVEEEQRDALESAMRGARVSAEHAGQPVTTEVLVGPLVDTVLRAIERHSIDLLVLGETNDSFERDHRTLAHKAPCPVFVARENVVQEFVGGSERKHEHWAVRLDKRVRLEGTGLMLQVFVGENDRRDGRPVYELIVERMRHLDMAGATVFPGELGYGATRHLHTASHLPWSHDRPVVVTVVDIDEAIQRAMEAATELVAHGLIVTSRVEIIKYAHRTTQAASVPA